MFLFFYPFQKLIANFDLAKNMALMAMGYYHCTYMKKQLVKFNEIVTC